MQITPAPATPSIVYKVVSAAAWTKAQSLGRFDGSADDVRDGYIHLSSPVQLNRTLEKHFMGQPDLLLIAFDAASLGTSLKWEPSRGGDLFPHLYATLPANLALWHRPLALDMNGVPQLDAAWLAC